MSGIFPGKADSVILLRFECTINSQNLMKIVEAIFEKIKILNFFLMWTTLNFRVRGKIKKPTRDIYMRTLHIEFERDRSIGLGSMIGDVQTHTHTHTHFFLKHICRLWEWCRMKNRKKNRSRIFWWLRYFLHSLCRSKVKMNEKRKFQNILIREKFC